MTIEEEKLFKHMKPEKLEDAHFFKRTLANDEKLSPMRSERIHEQYVAFVNENYQLKGDEKSHLDHINNKPSKHHD